MENSWFFPFKVDTTDDTDFVFNLFRSFENFDIINDQFSLFVEVTPIVEESSMFYIKSSLQYYLFRFGLFFRIFKYLFSFKT